MKRNILITLLSFFSLGMFSQAVDDAYRPYDPTPKREFRGVWVHTIEQNYFADLTSEQIKDTLRKQLDIFQKCGFNVLLFQIRPEADAFYKSDIEPWSRYLTGEQGKEPDDPDFDPMAFLIDECHKRCMEFHAWMNPYRANIKVSNPLAWGHIYGEKRYMFITYGTQLLFNPGVPECRDYICNVVKDVVTRYDVDAIHLDDYFYPYPIKGLKFPDDATFKRYGIPAGYTIDQKSDWRRDNVNKLVHQLSDTIHSVKPWVRFSISPFGIYRNKKQYEDGSNTNGLTCYDDLYADIMLWVKNGWINDCIPQLYWEDGHKNADYTTLINWWAQNTLAPCKFYVGQDVSRTYRQFSRKLTLSREIRKVEGNCFFSGKMILENMGNVQDSLSMTYHTKPALLPEYPDIDTTQPESPFNVRFDLMGETPMLKWDALTETTPKDEIRFFAVYMFDEGETIDLNRMDALLGFTAEKEYPLPENSFALCKQLVVTSIDRMHNESKPAVARYD